MNSNFNRGVIWAAVAVTVIGYAAFMVAIFQVASNPEPVAKHIGQIGRAVADGFNGK